MRKETYFKLNRIVLLSIVLCSLIIPKLIMPQFVQQAIQQPIEFELPFFVVGNNQPQEITKTENTSIKNETIASSYIPEKITQSHFSIQEMLVCLYITGLLISFLILVYGLKSIFILYREAKVIRMDGYRLLIAEKEIAAFSFRHLVFISQHDYEEHQRVILAHEKEHIRFGHFYDLVFLEVVKTIFWFNPFIYLLIRDMKDIHEFQTDDQTLIKGIDATQYQLLIIQKAVGHQKFALANSFNHCQIKNRIVMMNKQKTSKAWRWKVATFLPLLALLLMAFGKPGENANSKKVSTEELLLDTVKNAAPGKLQKFTPPQTSDIKIPKRNTFSIQIDAKGKVFVGFDGQDNRRMLLTRMGEEYNIVFSPKELEEFSKIDIFGVPMNRMKAFLKMSDEEKHNPGNAIGIPHDSGNNEFKNWVRTARTVNKDMRITLKGDQATSYQVIDQLIETLKDLNEYRLYLALAGWDTAYEIAYPSRTPGPGKFSQKAVLDTARNRPRVVTIIPDKDNSIYYYLGTQDSKGIKPVLTKTDYSPFGIHKVLIDMNYDVFAKMEVLRKKKENGELSEEEVEKQRNEIFSSKTAAIVLIKPTDASTYGSLMNILDEMVICSIGRYAIIDLSDYDRNLIRKAR